MLSTIFGLNGMSLILVYINGHMIWSLYHTSNWTEL